MIDPGKILSVMEEGTWYRTSDIADLLGVPSDHIYRLISELERNGKLNADRYGHKKRVQLKSTTSIAGPAYIAPRAPLTGYDPGALMRLCNAGRKAETGMA